MRIFSTLFTVACLGYAGVWLSQHHPETADKALHFFSTKQAVALQPKYTPEQLIELHEKLLLKGNNALQGSPFISYVPLLLMEVKYADTSYTTGEGLLLWDLADGEMIINANTWEKTHGLADCIRADVTKEECRIVALLAKKGGQVSKESLRKALKIETDLLEGWVDECKRKKLLLPTGGSYRLHIQNPKMPSLPITLTDTSLTTFTTKKAKATKKEFSEDEIIEFAETFFGGEFAVKNAQITLLPIYCITTNNNKQLTTHFYNSLTGKPITMGLTPY